MNKTFEVAKYEYLNHVSKKGFWLGILALPIGMVLLVALTILLSTSSIDRSPVGIVDQSGLMALQPEEIKNNSVFSEEIQLVLLETVEEAKEAAGAGQIQAYVVIPHEFLTNYRLEYHLNQPLTNTIENTLTDYIRSNLLADATVPNLQRIQTEPEFVTRSLDGTTTTSPDDFLKILIPMIISLLFFIVVIMSGSYLLQAVVEEKENRTMEVMVTSVSPDQLMTGKILGNISVGLTQLLSWVAMVAVFLFIFKNSFPFLTQLDVSLQDVAMSFLFLLPSFVFTSALMATLGATVTDTEESSQVAGLVVLPMTIPFYFMTVFLEHPNGAIAKVLSYFPISSPVATTMRMAATQLPTIEVIAIFLIQIAFAVFSIWLAGKAFKRGMLSYSKRLKLKDIFRKEIIHA